MRIAVIGAKGSVGHTILQLLIERNFPITHVSALGSHRSVGKAVSMGDETLSLQDAETFDFESVDLVFSATPTEVSRRLLPRAIQAGARVIDKSAAFRMKPECPLIVPEVNGDLLNVDSSDLIASPNCVAIPLTVVLAPFHHAAILERVVVSTYQSVSGMGRKGMDELYSQTRAGLMSDKPSPQVFQKPIAFNVLPQIGEIGTDGWSDEETKIREESRKILDLPSLPLTITAVRVPVFIGHSMAVTITLQEPLSLQEARQLLKEAPGISYQGSTESATPITTPLETVGTDAVFITRLRKDSSVPSGFCFWVTCDNLRKGAALNAIQIAESVIEARTSL